MANDTLDVRASALAVVALLRSPQGTLGLERLEALRAEQPVVLQEALDRYVAGLAPDALLALRSGAAPAQTQVLDRLDAARGIPRLPGTEPDTRGQTELDALSASQLHDVYASMVYTRGNEAARASLERGERVILGLRQENSTLAAMESAQRAHVLKTDNPNTEGRDESRSGTGIYNDQLVVLWRGSDERREVFVASRANTEPTAQYDHHAGSNGQRVFRDSGHAAPVLEASPGFEHVTSPRRIEGEDADGDRLRDAGRLREGTVEMFLDFHGSGTDRHRAFRPTEAAVRAGEGMVERDTNGDGFFNEHDVNGRQDLNDSFKIHRGSMGNTDSAGCQTIQGRQAYAEFLRAAVPAGNQQTRWQYVLTHVSPSTPVLEQDHTNAPTPGAPAVGSRAGDISPAQRAAVLHTYGQIGPGLQSLGRSLDDVVRVCAACVAHGATTGGDVRNFVLSKDGQRIAAMHANGQMTELEVSAALDRSMPEHLAQATAAVSPQAPLRGMYSEIAGLQR